MTYTPEKTRLHIGVVPLSDAAPIVLARSLGNYARHGLDVAITVEASWASLRDKLAAGMLDAAQMLAPMPLAAALRIDGVGVPMLTAMSLNLNGNAITVSEALYGRLRRAGTAAGDPLASGRALRRVIETDRAAGAPLLQFAHVFPYSMHHYELRYWLAANGIDPDHDLELRVIPPPQMVQQLREGHIDGYCVGAPWGGLAEAGAIGRRLVSSYSIWNNAPEKVLGVTRAWADAHPQTHRALLAALLETSAWLDEPAHRDEAAQVLLESALFDPVVAGSVRESLRHSDAADPGLLFHDACATFPWRSHARWILRQMQRWGQADANIDVAAVASSTYCCEIYREVARTLGLPLPASDDKPEGQHSTPWRAPAADGGEVTLGPDRFCDGARSG